MQSHLVIDFPIKGPANAKALPEELPPLMSDLATAQDDLGTVHFSRFMVEGDEKLLFLSDIDGEVDQHIERLVESAGPVLDAIFTHVDDPPAAPVANNPERVTKWLKHHVREPLDTYFAYGDASVQDIKAAARAAGFTGNTSQGPLLTYMPIKSRAQAFALKLVGKSMKDDATKGRTLLERCIFPIGCPFRTTTWASSRSTTVIGGVHPGLRRQDLVRLRYDLSTCRWRAANPSSEERPGVLPVGIGKQPSAHRVLQRLSRPRGSRHQSPAGRLSQATIGDRWIARGSHGHEPWSIPSSALAKEHNTQAVPAMRGSGLLRRFLGRRRHENPQTDGGSGAVERSALDLADVQGFIRRGYRMPMVRHFLLAVGVPAQARRQLGRLVSGNESDAPQITTAEDSHVGFAPGPGDDPPIPRVTSPTIASTSASRGPDWLRWR